MPLPALVVRLPLVTQRRDHRRRQISDLLFLPLRGAMATVHFITHLEVVIDPAVSVPDRALSPMGVQRMRVATHQPWLAGVQSVFSSAERKDAFSFYYASRRPLSGWRRIEG